MEIRGSAWYRTLSAPWEARGDWLEAVTAVLANWEVSKGRDCCAVHHVSFMPNVFGITY